MPCPMQALKLLQAGSTERADALLCCLGCTHRLADAVLLCSSAASSVVERSLRPSLPAVLTSALPGGHGKVISKLCKKQHLHAAVPYMLL